MEEQFDKLLTSMLEGFDSSKQDIDSYINDKVKEANLSEKDREKLKKTNEWIDAFDKNAKELSDVTKDGKSRSSWFKTKFNKILEGRTDKEKTAVANTLLDSDNDIVNNLIKED